MFDEITIQRLKYYVYALVNPKDNMPFYIGKEEVGSSNLLADSIVSRHTEYLALYLFLPANL